MTLIPSISVHGQSNLTPDQRNDKLWSDQCENAWWTPQITYKFLQSCRWEKRSGWRDTQAWMLETHAQLLPDGIPMETLLWRTFLEQDPVRCPHMQLTCFHPSHLLVSSHLYVTLSAQPSPLFDWTMGPAKSKTKSIISCLFVNCQKVLWSWL